MHSTTSFTNEILEAGLLEISEPRQLAGGDIANNHLNLDRLHEHNDLFERVTSAMAHLIIVNECKIDFLAPIPTGGNMFAETISEKLRREGHKIPVIEFAKTSDGMFSPIGSFARGRLGIPSSGVIVDDVSTRLSTLDRFLRSPYLEGHELSFCAVWRRGTEETELAIPIKVKRYWLIEEPIPTQLDETSPLWEYVSKGNE